MSSMSSKVTALSAEQRSAASWSTGAIGGVAAGMVFGMLMQMMGMIPMVASLVGSDSIAVGWFVHLLISAVFGVAFVLVVGRRLGSLRAAAGLGAAYGMVLWVVGPLLLMPAKLGMPLGQINATAVQSLMGHILYGVILGLVAARLRRRTGRTG
ncbi:DUF6789 family protein [Gordonia sp. (in: high G+C Gram-positive bacteria)]|jgi:uncharacterized membrane protein YagU involved in acid resistance|uniref:DUF6789 family protein n=1 Tax=Gordonia sp. (in: high G+C Gram-positive bacteria) TaxID=84139 RepID=UPI002632DC53|nr:DUF6789 family protein [Gordonia sp. (in: high G+C Gram-positive bacteria)]